MADKPEGQELEFGKRAGIENLDPSKGIDEIIKEIDAFYRLEREVIEKHIESVIRAEYNKDEIGSSDSLCNPNSDKRKNLLKKIEEIYSKEVDEKKEQLLKDAEEKLFEKKYYPFSKVIFSRVAFIFIIFLEVVLLIAIGLSQGGGFNPVILLYGLFLLVGSYLIGEVMGQLFYQHELGRLGKYNVKTDSMPPVRFYTELVLGLVIIFFVAILRASGTYSIFSMASVFLVTVILSLIAAFFEAKAYQLSKMREWAIRKHVEAMQVYANKEHRKAIKNKVYENKIESECQKYIRNDQTQNQKEENV